MKLKSFLAIALIIGGTALSSAQIPSIRIEGKQETKEVYLQSLNVQVDITGTISTTKFTLVFKNRTGKILEGELLFPLPEGVTVSHYALDINGKIREAVPVEKAKATQVFEEIEQRRVDPGLLERVEGNNFRTRIYPIPANGTRTISIGYEQELPVTNNRITYRLPMDYKEAIDNFSLKATVWQGQKKPVIDEIFENELTFDKQNNNFVANYTHQNYQPSRSLVFSLPVSEDIPQVLMQSASGSYYFLASCALKPEQRKKIWKDELCIIWDVSLSGLKRDIPHELEMLDAIINEKRNLSIDLYLLNNKLNHFRTFNIKNGDWSELRSSLNNVDFDGGTDYSIIELNKLRQQEILFFSDGLSSLSDADEILKNSSGKTVHCVISSPTADYSAMKWIASNTNGKFINLNSLSREEATRELMTEPLRFLGIRKPDSVTETYPSVTTSVHENFSISGIVSGSMAEITLLFGYGNQPTIEKKVILDAQKSASQGNIHRIWAQKKINELDMQNEKNKDELTILGEQFGIVTRNTSLIVLETLQDYITYRITPPAELLAEYNRIKKAQSDNILQQQQSLLASAKSAAELLKKWWNTDYKPVKNKYPKPDGDQIIVVNEVIETETVHALDFAPLEESRVIMQAEASSSTGVNDFAFFDRRSDERRDTKDMELSKKVAQKNIRKEEVQPTIKRIEIKQDSEYMKLLTGNVESDYRKYLKIRSEYIGTPTFYFDMANWFFSHNDKAKALLILTSIADLDLENASLFRLLGYRLKEYGEYKLEAYICKKVIQWRPMEPQSYRDYALALADGGQKQAALDSLYSLLTKSYANNINQRSTGIEEVVVTELNQLAANNKLNLSGIDKDLVMNMPVDIRVVINWNKNSTDIDLHVADPTGEKCFYSHKETAMGGRISNDITQGYGPEQFMLKKAIKGKYHVYVNYFGDSQVKVEGPATVMLEVYTKYSGKEEQRQVICLQMSKEVKQENGLIKVAEFEF